MCEVSDKNRNKLMEVEPVQFFHQIWKFVKFFQEVEQHDKQELNKERTQEIQRSRGVCFQALKFIEKLKLQSKAMNDFSEIFLL